MTNKEAIALLRNLEDSLDSYCELNEEGKTAFRMAIEALNRSENPNNSDCISRQAAIDTVKYDYFTGYTQLERVNEIKAIPAADVVPVVRCDDCVYYGSRRWCELHSSVFDDNAFCSYGERKEA